MERILHEVLMPPREELFGVSGLLKSINYVNVTVIRLVHRHAIYRCYTPVLQRLTVTLEDMNGVMHNCCLISVQLIQYLCSCFFS